MTTARGRAGRLLSSMLMAALIALGGCAVLPIRAAAPESGLDRGLPYGIDEPLLRVWGDGLDERSARFIEDMRAETMARAYADEIAHGETIRSDSLALSGGGPDGAFGAGLLAGWAERGDRPEFSLVTGVSTGAIIAVFAFLGPEYDHVLHDIYAGGYRTEDLATPRLFSALFSGASLFDVSGYRRVIETYIDDELVGKLAEAYGNGRMLLIGTTNMDASRPVNWNIGAIAASGHPKAKTLIRDVIQASSAIPAAFPPVLIPVEIDGRRYDEMHVDGGATQQVMLFTPEIRASDIAARVGAKFDRRVWVIINNKLRKPYEPVRPTAVAVAQKAASSLIGGSGSGDVYRIFAIAERDRSSLNLISVPRDFAVEAEELFDPVYMGQLYELGYRMGLSGEGWSPYPPDFAPSDLNVAER
ncbi:MAG: patatin-like phospholipase family protein [Pikeienuella sp.]